MHNSVAPALSRGRPAAERPDGVEDQMIALFLLLVIVAIVLGIVGVVAKGLLYLLIIGIVVFLGALLLAALPMRRRPGRRAAR
jgi:Flp pilus assembly protein TadB